MIISPGRGYVFVHIPKTGGTAVALALEARAKADDILIGDTPKAQRRRHRLKGVRTAGRLWKHSALADIEGLVTREVLGGMFIFSIVRNPWDRMVSYYCWLRDQGFDHPAVRLAQSCDFPAFLAHPMTGAAQRANPYVSYLCDGAGREHCDLWLRFEHLQDDLRQVEARLGLRLPPLERVNQSNRPRDYRSYYSVADAERIAELCQVDIARFGYSFG
ncbi:sulfotransferase family 2 domain-containing protein [Alkalilacustris brevis]|uniref:sulfotransferase family 2 domain-containing protein n=1 Tax=Alkalilacustris brevis TaxID=2026338 RepID=UPI000E0DA605|nr:sulfotransferase family 2 domain-containing protein [Alkalilacustris brevis]